MAALRVTGVTDVTVLPVPPYARARMNDNRTPGYIGYAGASYAIAADLIDAAHAILVDALGPAIGAAALVELAEERAMQLQEEVG